jgi:zinc protease
MIASGMPQAGPPRSVPLPRAHEIRLENGLRVVVCSRAEMPGSLRVPLVSGMLMVDRGSAGDPPKLPGVSAMTSALLRQGTRRHTALELDQAVDAIGARLDRSSSYDASIATASATSAVFPQALGFLAETVREPTFAPEEFERMRTRTLSDLRLTYSSPSSLARLVAARVVGGDSPYGHPISGTRRSLEMLGRDDVVAFHRHAYRPEHATLLLGGDVAVDAAFELADQAFGAWQPDPHPVAEAVAMPPPSPRRRVVVVDKPDAGRTAVAVTRSAPPRPAPSYYTSIVTAAVLSGYSGRLNQEVRVKRGLSYGAAAQLVARRDSGQFSATTLVDHKRTIEAVRVILETLASLETAPPDERELTARKASLLGTWNRLIETNDGLLAALSDFALYGIALDELERYTSCVEAVGSSQVAAFARDYVTADPAIVLVGDARVYADELPTLAADVRVIPFAELELDGAI